MPESIPASSNDLDNPYEILSFHKPAYPFDAVYLVLPVILILLVGGFSGFLFARDRMIDQLHKRVTLQLERAAHKIELAD